jgi:hypothetical protein
MDDKCHCGKPGTHWWEGAQRGGYHCDEHHAEFLKDNEHARRVNETIRAKFASIPAPESPRTTIARLTKELEEARNVVGIRQMYEQTASERGALQARLEAVASILLWAQRSTHDGNSLRREMERARVIAAAKGEVKS